MLSKYTIWVAIALMLVWLPKSCSKKSVSQARKETPAISASVITVTPLTITGAATCPTAAQVGVFYTCTFTASGGTPPYHWTIIPPSELDGLTMTVSGANSQTLTVSGKPLVATTLGPPVNLRIM